MSKNGCRYCGFGDEEREQIRNEALEEAKEAVCKPVPGVTSEHAVTLMHACDRINALAASEDGK